jgi:hypothetical protein
MSTKITPKVKNKVWQDYTKNYNSKNELKQMFLGMNPTNAYEKISLKLKKKLDQVKASSSPRRKTIRPKILTKSSKGPYGPSGTSRKTTKSKRISSPKRTTSPTGLKRSPKRRISPISPKRSPKRRPSNPSKTKLVRSPSRKSKKDKLSSVRLIKS